MSRMSAILCLAAAILVVVSAEEQPRFLATVTTGCLTATATKVITATTTFNATTNCATTSNITAATCRRRRGIEEAPLVISLDGDIDLEDLAPSQPLSVEASAAPSVSEEALAADPSIEAVPASAEISSSQDGLVEVSGFEPACVQNRFFFGSTVSNILTLTLQSTCTTTTVNVTSYTTVTQTVATNTFTLVGCVPTQLSSKLCK